MNTKEIIEKMRANNGKLFAMIDARETRLVVCVDKNAVISELQRTDCNGYTEFCLAEIGDGNLLLDHENRTI